MTIYGSDVSHFDQSDTRAMFAEGIVFQTHKAGGDRNDPELGDWWDHVKDYRPEVLLGAYWVLYPGNGVSRADAFLARLNSQCPGWKDGPFILQVDCEKWNGDSKTVPTKADIKAFCDRLVAKMPKLRPIVYAPRWVYGNTLDGLGYPLWASAYVTGSGLASVLYPGDSSSKWAVYSGQVPEILQFTSSAIIGGQTTCDANAFRGTLRELINLVAPGWVPEEVDVAIEQADIDKIVKGVWEYKLDVTVAKDGTPNMQPAGGILRYGSSEHRDIRDRVQSVFQGTSSAVSLLSQLAARPEVDETVLAEELASRLAPLIPESQVDADSLAAAFRELFAQEANTVPASGQ